MGKTIKKILHPERYGKPYSVQYKMGPNPTGKIDGLSSLKIGPGGPKCGCCFPAPGTKDRKERFHLAKVKAKREAFRIEYEEIAKED